MANQAIASVGTTVSVSNTIPANLNAAGYAALTYTLVGEASEMPEFGGEQALVTFTPLQTGIVEKRGGSIDYGEVTLPLALSRTDAGQLILENKANQAIGTDKRVTVRVTLPDTTNFYFVAQVRSFKQMVGGVDAITMANTILARTSPVVKT